MNNIVFKDLSTKRFKMLIFILTFLIFCICFINQIINVFDNKIYKEVLNKSENRLIYAKSDDNKIDLINSFNNVEYVTYNYNFFMQSSTFGACNFKYLVPESGKINKKYLTDDVIISSYTLEKLNLNSNDILGTKINIIVNDETINLNITDVYDDQEKNEYMYIPSNSLLNKYIDLPNKYIILIDNINNYSKVKNNLLNNQLQIEAISNSYKSELEIYKHVNNLLNDFNIACYFILIIIFSVFIFSNIYEKKKNIALLKAVGYSNIYILKVILLYYSIFLVLSFIMSFLLILLINIIIFKIKGFYFIDIINLLENYSLIFSLLVCIITLFIFIIKKIMIIKMLKD